jgi:hypothetical protein
MSQDEPPSRARVVARVVIVVVLVALVGFGYTMGRPVYWRMYATVLKPFRDDGTLHGARPSVKAITPSTTPRSPDHAALHVLQCICGYQEVKQPTKRLRPSGRTCFLK